MDGVGRRLACFAVGRDGAPPERVLREANRALVNIVGAALGGCRDPAVESLAQVFAALGGVGGGDSPLFGRRERLDPVRAAIVNAAAGNALDFDDTHPATVIHPSAPVAAAAFACAGLRRIDGRSFLEALAIGIEATCRLGLALGPRHYAGGHHITATCGAVGAAAAAARLLGLDERRALDALGIAATRAGGLVENLNYMAKSAGVGGAAGDGVLAALLARSGMRASPAALDGPNGFLAVLGPEGSPQRLADGLAETWEMLANAYKPYPTGVVINPVIAACLGLRGAIAGDLDAIEVVEVTGSDLLLARADRPTPVTTRDARLSVQHAAAAALARGACGLAEFAGPTITDPAVARLRGLVAVGRDPAFGIGQARVTIRLAGGREVVADVEDRPSSPREAMSDADLSRKLIELCAHGAPEIDPGPLLTALWSLERLGDVGLLLTLATPAAAPGRA